MEIITHNQVKVRLTEFSEHFLSASLKWLNDPEIRSLLNMKEISQTSQQEWFDKLQHRDDYQAWGVLLGETPIGAVGIRNIANGEGELWGYIGEKQYWWNGIGNWMLNSIEEKAREFGLRRVYLHVLSSHYKAINLYFKNEFKIKAVVENGGFLMEKDLP